MKKLLFLFLFISAFANAQVLDQSNIGGSSSYQIIDSGVVVRQSFIAGVNGQLASIDIDAEVFSCSSGLSNLWFACYVYDSSGTNVIANQTSGIPVPYSRGLFSIGFVAPATMQAGSLYYFDIFASPQICDSVTSTNATMNWFSANDDSTYTFGTADINSTPLNIDMYFQTHVTAGCANPIIANPFVVSSADCGMNNAELSVTPTGGDGFYTYSWSPSGGNAQSTGQTLTPGMYTVTVSDTSGCTTQGSIFATVSNPIYATSGVSANIDCYGTGTLYCNPSGGAGIYTFLWSTGATTQNLSGITVEGTYTITVSDSTGCTATESVFIPNTSMNVVVNPYNTTCGLVNGYIYATPNYANGPSFSWTGPSGFTSTSQNIFNLIPGTYELIVTDTVCPSYYDTIVVAPSTGLTYTITVNNNITCIGNHDGSATIAVSTGTSGYVGWGNGENGYTAYNLPPGSTTIFVNDSSSCTINDTVFISEPTQLMDSLAYTEPACGLSNGSVAAYASGGTAPYSYFWSTGNTGSNISGVEAGIYMVDIYDANGCLVSDAAILGSAGGPVINQDAFSDITCSGANDGMIAVSITGGTAPYTVFWTDMDSSYTTLTRTNLQGGPYELVVADISGCQTIFNAYINNPDAIYADFNYISPVSCVSGDGSIDAMVYGGAMPYSYNWNNGQTTSTNSNLMADVYTLTITDANGCIHTSEAYLSDNTALDAFGNGIVTNCGTNTGSIDITPMNGSGLYSFDWSNGATTEDISSLYPGYYGVTITDGVSGCKKALEFNVTSSTASYAPEVCMVTVDTLDEKNVIIWERPTMGGIKEFVIYRETSQADVYRYIGTTPIDSLTQLKDTVANADLHGWKYKISAIDSCGVETGVSEVEHRPVFLTVDTNGVGLPSLVWTDYIGRPITDYIVKRNANNTGWIDVATVPSSQTSFDDVNCPSGYIEYTIEVVFATTCEAARGAINTSRSNIKSPSSLIVGVKENKVNADKVVLYPNPSSDDFSVSLSERLKENAKIEVVNSLGQVIYNSEIAKGNKVQTINAANWITGIYFIRINSSEIHTTIKFVKQ
ncbi:MAG: T9SS type A sorting domain-containing protein [Bacteroidota bacterium]|nr:T9SS type A sorting domain-containing protein [Bacteroidota bacterium]